jgi:Domain of unknown function (DUF4382)
MSIAVFLFSFSGVPEERRLWRRYMTGKRVDTKHRAPHWAIFAISGLLLAGILMAACSGGGSSTPAAPAMAAASVMLSDPATCSGPAGPFAHVFVTITDVQANVSSTAGDGDSGWTDLTPGLSSQPKQVDLLGQANNQCPARKPKSFSSGFVQ